ncbi:MAG: histidine kinase [Verrucomicrobiota bacterium]
MLPFRCIVWTMLWFATSVATSGMFNKQSESVKEQIAAVELALDALPKESLSLAPWTLGYRSGVFQDPEIEIEIRVEFENPAKVDLAVLMPATFTEDGRHLEPFVFPQRFKIECLYPDGSKEIAVDHRNSDYEIEGVAPQLFKLPSERAASGLLLTVTKLSSNTTWVAGRYRLALGELFVFSGNWNVALNQPVNASSVANYSHIWSVNGLVDGFSLFSPINRSPDNPNLVPLRLRNLDHVELIFDLGEVYEIDEYHFWPLVHDLQFNYPPSSGIGFPRGIQIETALQSDFSDARLTFQNKEVFPAVGSNPLMLRTARQPARYVKVSLNNIVYDYRINIPELIVDEIEIFRRGELISDGIIPNVAEASIATEELEALTDGRTTEGQILSLKQWLIDFSRRVELERKLVMLKRDLEVAESVERARIVYILIAAVAVIFLLVLLIWLVYLISERRWDRVRERIAADLHDDLGANMISVAHSVELMQHSIEQPSDQQKRLLGNAIHTAHKTAEDTRQIVRLLERNKSGITWTETLQETVESLLPDIKYSIQMNEKRAFNQLNAVRQWDLLLFIKEGLNNVVKHANAEKVVLTLERHEGRLRVIIEDDGDGIDDTNLPVRHLENRAKFVKGTFCLETKVGRGTRIILELK